MNNLIIQNILESKTYQTPIWLMRQAGRYMNEYKKIKKNFLNFMNMCKDTNAVTEITLQPIKKFDFDAAIIFSDILIILDAINIDVNFIKGKGPIVSKPENLYEIKSLPKILNKDKVIPCYKSISLVKKELKNKPLIGFAAAPWTLATYYIEGQITKDLSVVRKFSYEYTKEMDYIIELFTNLIIEHIQNQIEAGADCIQIFDTHAYQMDYLLHKKYSLKQIKIISEKIKNFNPNIPILFYTKSNLVNDKDYIEKNVDCLSFNSNIDMAKVKDVFSEKLCFQGNLDPMLLVVGGEEMKKATFNILKGMKNKKFIFNLGHGVLPQTPVNNVEKLINYVREYKY